MKFFIFFLILFSVFIIGCSDEVVMDNVVGVVTSNGVINVSVSIADSPDEQARGLMNVDAMEEFEGMLFEFPYPTMLSFWMKDTYIPLDIIYVDENLKIIEIKSNVQPCGEDPCHVYPSSRPAKYVLEVNGGFCNKYGVEKGDELRI